MDWIKVGSKWKEILAVITVLTLLLFASLQWAAAETDVGGTKNYDGTAETDEGGLPEGEGGAEHTTAPPINGEFISAVSKSFQSTQVQAVAYSLANVTYGSGGNNQAEISLTHVDGEGYTGEIVGPFGDNDHFRVHFTAGTRPPDTEMGLASNVRIAPANQQGSPGGQTVTHGIQSNNNDPSNNSWRINITGALQPGATYFLLLSEALLGEGNGVQIKFTTAGGTPSDSIGFTFNSSQYDFGSGLVNIPSNGIITAAADSDRGISFRLQFENVPGGNIQTHYASLGTDIIYISSGGAKVVDFKDSSVTITTGGGQQAQMRASIAAGTLEQDAAYSLIIDKSLAGGSADTVITFSTDKSSAPDPVDFAAVFVYPAAFSNNRNAAVDQPFTVVFTQEADETTLPGNVRVTSGGDTVAISVSLGADKKTLTVTPQTNLDYGTDYTLSLAADIQNSVGEKMPDDGSITFRTKTFDITNVTADLTADEDGNYTMLNGITVSLNNRANSGNSTPTIKVVIRRDLGARIDGGGTVVYIGEVLGAQVSAGASGTVEFSGLSHDVTKDLYDAAVIDPYLDAYMDVYVLDNNGRQIGDPYHLKI